MAEQFLMRDMFNPGEVNKLAEGFKVAWHEFDQQAFTNSINSQLGELSLKERSQLIQDHLEKHLPDDFPEAAQIIQQTLLQKPELNQVDFRGFILMPVGQYVSSRGINYFDISIGLLKEITKRFTAEFDIRPFIIKYPEDTLAVLQKWAVDENFHVRRLVSEGTRPTLPWAPNLRMFQEDPRPILQLLELLKEDKELYVRRSVANNLNSIARNHPELVVETLTRWKETRNKDTKWIIRHASRTLVKQGHKEALSLQGYKTNPKVQISGFELSHEQLPFGADLAFSFEVTNTAKGKQNLLIDYAIHYMKANGQPAAKVFKLTQKKVKKGEVLTVRGKRPFKPISTRKYYPGEHQIEIFINGKSFAKQPFELLM